MTYSCYCKHDWRRSTDYPQPAQNFLQAFPDSAPSYGALAVALDDCHLVFSLLPFGSTLEFWVW